MVNPQYEFTFLVSNFYPLENVVDDCHCTFDLAFAHYQKVISYRFIVEKLSLMKTRVIIRLAIVVASAALVLLSNML